MKQPGKVIGAALAGASLMYLLDPDRGARRRALMRDQTVHAKHRLSVNLGRAAHDLGNRARGSALELRARWQREIVDDVILHERIRSAIGRAVSHPGAIEVAVEGGRVTLKGHVLEHELRRLLRQARRVRGVTSVINAIRTHHDPDAVPSLQGGRPRHRPHSWSLHDRALHDQALGSHSEPRHGQRVFGRRILGATLGGMLVCRGVRGAHGGRGPLQALLGMGLLVRALTRARFAPETA